MVEDLISYSINHHSLHGSPRLHHAGPQPANGETESGVKTALTWSQSLFLHAPLQLNYVHAENIIESHCKGLGRDGDFNLAVWQCGLAATNNSVSQLHCKAISYSEDRL